MTHPHKVGPNSRESDERILDWLEKTERGWEPVRIAERWGVHRSTVNRTLREFEDVLS